MKTILIIGMGEFGKHLAYRLLDLKADVCVVDTDKELINVLSEDFENAYVADCTKDAALKDLGVKTFDVCVVSVGSDLQTSLEITSKLRLMGAKYIIAKATNTLQSKFLIMAGANESIYPEKDIASKVAQMCIADNVLDAFVISDEYSVFEMKVRNEWIGKPLNQSNIRSKYNLNVMAVRGDNGIIVPDPEYVFTEDDSIFLFGKSSVLKKLSK